ncbi:MAG: radical SAM protein [Oscillospiraceae bacterium]|nr:radical SAM protein [Oscillospiraceae bacterium]
MNDRKIAGGTRLYINITNACNTDCPFCCMYSGTDKSRFMEFDTYRTILDSCGGEFEVQLEGGEPLIHKDFFRFAEYAVNTGRCRKLIILTNGLELDRYMDRLADLSARSSIPAELKISVNYWLLQTDENHLRKLRKYILAAETAGSVSIKLNVRKRASGDEDIETALAQYGLLKYSSIYYLQSYGKLKGSPLYEGPVIVQNISSWGLYASDGTFFGQDLVARSEYEK